MFLFNLFDEHSSFCLDFPKVLSTLYDASSSAAERTFATFNAPNLPVDFWIVI